MRRSGGDLPRFYHLLCCGLYSVVCVGWGLWAGRDQNVDQLHYHVYVALAWWQGRLPDELFAANAQGYLNPLPHVPFLFALMTGWKGVWVASIMAILHSANLWLLHGVAVLLVQPVDRMRRALVPCGVLLGAMTPAVLMAAFI